MSTAGASAPTGITRRSEGTRQRGKLLWKAAILGQHRARDNVGQLTWMVRIAFMAKGVLDRAKADLLAWAPRPPREKSIDWLKFEAGFAAASGHLDDWLAELETRLAQVAAFFERDLIH
jgi:hypothetical protein